ncbi:sensor histidine kinase [Dactylosporangium roseum]|uniref:histidine kinase n=1 Tax=Dactylosporangium roseum TaxID=47989 RepID=A0ABY5Z255_9ACTN|nr:nitrate- and nitrite sensing domain-containing protein [Dactylosporangium roseum]UWZ35686.1 sensor histidine kinase [Dactylosporangium roseum]
MKSRSWRIRTWSIRAKIIALLLPPIASLVGMWIFATSLTAGAAFAVFDSKTYYELTGKPSETVIVELQRERKLSLVYIASGRVEGQPATTALAEQRTKTDKAVADFRGRAERQDVQDALPKLARSRLREVLTSLDQLTGGRTGVRLGQVDRAGAMEMYAGPIDAIYRWYNALPGISHAELSRDGRTVIATSRARELFAREDALVNGVATAGKFVKTESSDLIAAIGAARTAYAEATAALPEPGRTIWNGIVAGDAYKRVREFENRILADARATAPLPIDIAAWRDAYDKLSEQLRTFDLDSGAKIITESEPVAVGIIVRLVGATVLGLLAVAISIALSVRIGRSLIRRLTSLRQDAQNLADVRLPELVGRLRHGEELDVAAAAPPLEYGADEIGKVGNAFSAVQRTAVESAAHEAQLRRGLNEVFLNIARRSQTLLHRQLALLDRMERRTTDPEELEDLFRVDHLATRMRRHAEDLVILAGAAPGRGWRNPVPMVDVVRGAVSEVEDYARVGFLALPEASLVGRAVADVIHLLAEIIENATSYSPPHTRVQISGQLVPNGYALEIEDRGLGMAPEAIEEANQRLLHPPDFDPGNSARLGLFVVALLAARHGVRVTLRSSAYGGVTAVVLIPPHLIAGAPPELTASTAAEQQADAVEAVLELDAADVVRPTIEDVGPPPQLTIEPQAVETLEVPPPPPPRPEEPELTDDGLPRRRRQANLAPQLRERSDDEHTVDGIPAARFATTGVGGRSPEQTRAMMSSLQAGFTRGRRDAALADDQSTPERDA